MKYLTKYWKTIAALTYITICILDFIIMPGYIISYALDYKEYILEMFEVFKDRPEIFKYLIRFQPGDWMPFTLRGAGLFHISFGAILTGAVINGRKNKKEDESKKPK